MEHRREFWVLLTAIFAASVGIGIIAPLISLYAHSLGATGLLLGLIFSAFSISRSIFMPFLGKLSDLRGRRPFIILGLAAYGAISLLYTLAESTGYLLAVRFLHGLAAAMVFPVAMAYVGEITPPGREGTYMGTFNVAFFGGFGLGPLMGGGVRDLLGIQAAFYIMGALSTVALLLVLFLLPESPSLKRRGGERPSYRALLRLPLMRGLMAFRLVGAAGMSTIMTFLPILVVGGLKLSGSQLGLLISAAVLTASVLQVPSGRLADRLSRNGLVASGGILAGLAILCIPLMGSFRGLLIVSLTLGVANAISLPAATALLVGMGRGHGMGSSMALLNLAMSIGF
ncbi:MAG: MFS transporter, partial [Nitrospinota bacterium]